MASVTLPTGTANQVVRQSYELSRYDKEGKPMGSVRCLVAGTHRIQEVRRPCSNYALSWLLYQEPPGRGLCRVLRHCPSTSRSNIYRDVEKVTEVDFGFQL